MSNKTLPFFDLKKQYFSIKEEIDSAVQDVIASGNYILGPKVKEFESKFAEYNSTKFAIGVNSGTDALRLALEACDINKGSEVIVPVNTFIATALAVSSIGAKVVFAEFNKETYNIDVQKLESLITKKTKAIIPVHMYGLPSEIDKITDIAKKYNLIVIEDACQAHGAFYKERMVGTWGDVGVYSFYPSKNLGAYGDAGMVVTNDKNISERIISLRNYGQSVKYYHNVRGSNCRLDEIQAAVLNVKLKHLNRWIEKRRKLANLYVNKLKGLNIDLPCEFDGAKHVYYLFVVRVKEREKFQRHLETNNIQTMIHYPVPLHIQEAYSDLHYKKGDFKLAEEYADKILSLPLYPELEEEQICYVCEKIKAYFHEYN